MTSRRWWQLPTILSLDAPLVMVTWQWLLARVAGAPLGWPPVAVLGLSVWLAYAADRWIEGFRLDTRAIRTQRHLFYQRFRWTVAVIWIAAFVADVWIAFTRLPSIEIIAGFALIAAVAAYLLSHQLVHRHHPWRAPKEICVAALLTGGVAVFLIRAPHLDALALPLALLALLCFTNCALISVWERDIDLAHGQSSLATNAIDMIGNARLIRQLPYMIVVLSMVAALTTTGEGRGAATSAAASALLLALLDRLEPKLGRALSRVLADAVLLTPLTILAWASAAP